MNDRIDHDYVPQLRRVAPGAPKAYRSRWPRAPPAEALKAADERFAFISEKLRPHETMEGACALEDLVLDLADLFAEPEDAGLISEVVRRLRDVASYRRQVRYHSRDVLTWTLPALIKVCEDANYSNLYNYRGSMNRLLRYLPRFVAENDSIPTDNWRKCQVRDIVRFRHTQGGEYAAVIDMPGLQPQAQTVLYQGLALLGVTPPPRPLTRSFQKRQMRWQLRLCP